MTASLVLTLVWERFIQNEFFGVSKIEKVFLSALFFMNGILCLQYYYS